MKAKTSFQKAIISEAPLNKAITVAITAMAKYIFAGVQRFLKSFIYTNSLDYLFFNDNKKGFLNLLTNGFLLNTGDLNV